MDGVELRRQLAELLRAHLVPQRHPLGHEPRALDLLGLGNPRIEGRQALVLAGPEVDLASEHHAGRGAPPITDAWEPSSATASSPALSFCEKTTKAPP